ncbi:hypothetical protein QQX09_13625 [Demequina sp. SYSU T00192]|uniref:Replication-associated protein ORF2/G2P domain-containing protein n=1 Tax=Demequina litoralis TaxID=3051660 RepID=A0ABT8GCM6_9MICO|nr:hypothetical protein [Demequina sp. SYSU T00192]MDN4476893.1 hypothetical protein [Demequina sp. SYSU T00192]
MLDATSPTAPGWHLSLYPAALEGGGYFRASIDRPDRSYVARGMAADPERAAREAGRRARAKLRRYCTANRLNRMGTLTYAGAGCHDPLQLRADVGEFFRNLRTALGDDPLPYVWVPEWHKSGHGLHVHFAVGKYIKRSVIEQAWGHGFVHIKLMGDLRAGAGVVEEARKAAGYVSKYVAKTFADPDARVLGLHRYDVGQGFQPEKVHLWAPSSQGLLDAASDALGSMPQRVWHSGDSDDWEGPPALWAQWGGR